VNQYAYFFKFHPSSSSLASDSLLEIESIWSPVE